MKSEATNISFEEFMRNIQCGKNKMYAESNLLMEGIRDEIQRFIEKTSLDEKELFVAILEAYSTNIAAFFYLSVDKIAHKNCVEFLSKIIKEKLKVLY